MDSKAKLDISVIITAYSEGDNLDRVLSGLSNQTIDMSRVEVLVLEAGNYPEDRARKNIGVNEKYLHFWHKPGLSRTESLNYLVRCSQGNLVVRLDARSHISNDYLETLSELSEKHGVSNVGGVINPVGIGKKQSLIAKVMSHFLSFGGGKNRRLHHYAGPVDTVYLGAFNKRLMPPQPWYDEKQPKISEDADLNYRIKKNGGVVFSDSSITVNYYPRETIREFFRLCFNWGVGRGLFIQKHKIVTGVRQLIMPAAYLIALALGTLGLFNPLFYQILILGILIYIVLLLGAALLATKSFFDMFQMLFCFLGCHLFWTLGWFRSFKKFEGGKNVHR